MLAQKVVFPPKKKGIMSKQSMEGMGEKNWPIKKLLIKISIKIEIKKARI